MELGSLLWTGRYQSSSLVITKHHLPPLDSTHQRQLVSAVRGDQHHWMAALLAAAATSDEARSGSNTAALLSTRADGRALKGVAVSRCQSMSVMKVWRMVYSQVLLFLDSHKGSRNLRLVALVLPLGLLGPLGPVGVVLVFLSRSLLKISVSHSQQAVVMRKERMV